MNESAMNHGSRLLPVAAALLLAGCVVLPPSGPSLQALPGSRMTFDQFQRDDAACREFATAQAGGRGPTEAAQESAAGSAVAGTLLGAAAGAALGGGSDGAAVGAGFGLLTGALVGMGTAETSYQVVQRRFDAAYYQCMYARGHRVPTVARYTEATPARGQPAAPPPSPRQPSVPPVVVATPPPDAGIPPPNAPPPPGAMPPAPNATTPVIVTTPPPDAGVPPPNAPPPAGPYVPRYWPNPPPR